jgi:hypothetical protein
VLKTCIRVIVVVCLVVLAADAARAQTAAAKGRLVVTVVDQTGAVLPKAAVTLAGEEEATRAMALAPLVATDAGVATAEDLAPGRYTLQVEFAGFETATIRDVRVRAGDNRRSVTLRLKKVSEEVTVGRDGQSSGLDPRGNAFSTVLTREMIAALPDDPEEMEAVLKAMSPPGSQFRIDGFTGGRMPAKSQIRSIRLPRMDAFAAQNHGGMNGMMFIDIMTQPGAGPLRGSIDGSFQDDALNARNPFTPVKGEEQLKQYGFSLSGTIRPNKTSFSMNAGGMSQYTSPNMLAILPDGSRVDNSVRAPSDVRNFNSRLDHALNADHAVRVSFDRSERDSRNQGVGGFNLTDRAYRANSVTNTLRLSENGPLGRRMFSESRLQLIWGSSSNESVIEAPTVRVLDWFTSGGGQMRGGQDRFELEAASDLDYVRGAHSWRVGGLVEGGRYRSDDISNYLGTYTFATLDDYHAGRPSSYTRKIGDPNLTYSRWQAGAYVQDDWRMTRSLMMSAGVRAGFQTLADDQFNLSPRVTLGWSPFRSGKLTLRTGYGYFYDWISGDLYKQTLLVDGFRQRELNVINPSYPELPTEGVTTVTNRYLWDDDLALPTSHRVNVGADRTLTPNQRLNVNYTFGWGRGLLRGRNLNAPVNGVRPDAQFANVLSMVSDAEQKTHSVNIGWNLTKLEWKRSFFFVNYTWSKSDTNTTGAFALPANGDNLDTEWGPSAGDVRHRASASLNMAPITNLSLSLNARAQSGTPYNITTGRDDNRDGLFNDRPAGVSRNSARTSAQWDLGGRLSYAWGFGTRPQSGGGPAGGPTVVVAGGAGGGGAMGAGFGGGAADKRFRIEFYLSGQNLLNRANYVGYSGVMTSPFFGTPTNVMNPRRLQMGVRFGF